MCVLTSQNTSRPKVPVQKLSPSRSIKTEVDAPGLLSLNIFKVRGLRAMQTLFNARCRATAALYENRLYRQAGVRAELSVPFFRNVCTADKMFTQRTN